jgi:hypothetical protein
MASIGNPDELGTLGSLMIAAFRLINNLGLLVMLTV